MPIAVSDARSSPNDQIAHAADVLKRSPRRRKVFSAIYAGKGKAKTVTQLMKATGLNRIAVLQEGGKLAGQQIVHQTKMHRETAYEKDGFYATNKKKILRLATNSKTRKAFPTKYSPTLSLRAGQIQLAVRGAKIQISEVTCDDFDQFSKVRKTSAGSARSISEAAFKAGVKKLIGETGRFQDWGGERNDLYTSKLRHKGRRRAVAFAFKGPGTSGMAWPSRSSRTTRMTRPAGPMFFCAPA